MHRLKIRNLATSDLKSLKEIHASNCDFPFPDLLNNLYCCNKVVEDATGGIVAVGIVRLTSETILIIDKTQPRSLRVRAIQHLFNSMRAEVKSIGLDETHAFIGKEDANLRRLLKKVFGFLECSARAIYLQF